MTLAVDSKGQIFNSHIYFWNGKVDEIGMKAMWVTMLDAQWACSLATVPDKYIDQVLGRCETVTVSNLLAHEWSVHTLI